MSAEERETMSEGAESVDTGGKSEPRAPSRIRPGRTGLLIGAALLAACGGLVLYDMLDTTDKPEKPPVPNRRRDIRGHRRGHRRHRLLGPQ